jgi:hypothetical protein
LPLKVRQFRQIAIDDAQKPDPRADKLLGDHRSQRPAPHQQRAGTPEPLLALRPDLRQDLLAIISSRNFTHDKCLIARL